MSHLLHRSMNGTYPVAIGGKGVTLIDADGKSYIDASGGAAVSCLGHGHPDILAAMHAQIDKLAYAHTASSPRPRRGAGATPDRPRARRG